MARGGVFAEQAGDVRLSPTAKLALIAEIARAYAPLRWTLRRRGLPAALARARTRAGEHRDAVPAGFEEGDVFGGALRLAAAVDRTLGALPVDSRCLMRALVLCALLARRGVPTKVVIGARAPDEDFIAHAWVELDGRPLQSPGSFDRLAEL